MLGRLRGRTLGLDQRRDALGIESGDIAKRHCHCAIRVLCLRCLTVFKPAEHEQRAVIRRGHCARAGAGDCIALLQERGDRGSAIPGIQRGGAFALIKDNAQSGFVCDCHRLNFLFSFSCRYRAIGG